MRKIKGSLLILAMIFSALPLVVVADTVPRFHILKGKPGGNTSGPQVEDWGYVRIGAAADRSATSGTVQVAVLDTGIDASHSDLSGLVTWCASAIKRATYNCGDRNVKDDEGHGTHVSGIITALDNSIDSVGAAAGHVELYNIKVLGRRGGDWNDLNWGIRAATNGPDGIVGTADDAEVISMSLGGDISSSQSTIDALQAAVDYAASHGVAVVAAAGNEGDCTTTVKQHSWPAETNGVITVGATGIYKADGSDWATTYTGAESDVIPCFTNDLPDGVVNIAAPGVYITSLKKGGGTTVMSGTSMATPYVSAIVALLMANGLSATQALNRITTTAISLPYASSLVGAGLLDASAAV